LQGKDRLRVRREPAGIAVVVANTRWSVVKLAIEDAIAAVGSKSADLSYSAAVPGSGPGTPKSARRTASGTCESLRNEAQIAARLRCEGRTTI
jgi:hypothetical protein